MSRRIDDFQLQAPMGESHSACLKAIERLNWRVAEVEPHRLLVKIGFGPFSGLFTNAAKIEVQLQDAGGNVTALHVEGRIAQVGPVGARKLGNHLRDLHEAVRLEAAKPPEPAKP